MEYSTRLVFKREGLFEPDEILRILGDTQVMERYCCKFPSNTELQFISGKVGKSNYSCYIGKSELEIASEDKGLYKKVVDAAEKHFFHMMVREVEEAQSYTKFGLEPGDNVFRMLYRMFVLRPREIESFMGPKKDVENPLPSGFNEAANLLP